MILPRTALVVAMVAITTLLSLAELTAAFKPRRSPATRSAVAVSTAAGDDNDTPLALPVGIVPALRASGAWGARVGRRDEPVAAAVPVVVEWLAKKDVVVRIDGLLAMYCSQRGAGRTGTCRIAPPATADVVDGDALVFEYAFDKSAATGAVDSDEEEGGAESADGGHRRHLARYDLFLECSGEQCEGHDEGRAVGSVAVEVAADADRIYVEIVDCEGGAAAPAMWCPSGLAMELAPWTAAAVSEADRAATVAKGSSTAWQRWGLPVRLLGLWLVLKLAVSLHGKVKRSTNAKTSPKDKAV